MRKEEIIREAYGEYWRLCNVDNDGYSEEIIYYFYPDELIENNFKSDLFRPKSLNGIETNNSWIKIESVADLPKEDDNGYWMVERETQEIVYNKGLSNYNKTFVVNYFSHFQKIIKPLPPLF